VGWEWTEGDQESTTVGEKTMFSVGSVDELKCSAAHHRHACGSAIETLVQFT